MGTPTDLTTRSLADTLVDQFEHMVRRDGGSLSVLDVDDGTIRIGYRLGADPTCEDGACVMPGTELRMLMVETVRRRDPELDVVVEIIQ